MCTPYDRFETIACKNSLVPAVPPRSFLVSGTTRGAASMPACHPGVLLVPHVINMFFAERSV